MIPETRVLSYLKLCTEVIQDGSSDPAYCPAFHPPRTTFDSFDNAAFPVWIQASGPIWVASPAGAPKRFGSFAPVRVRTLAFGSIPISATVHISQPVRRGGEIAPLTVDYLSSASPVPAAGGRVFGNSRWAGFRIPPNDGRTYINPGFRISGKVDLRVSDVKIDGRPVRVGATCQTSRSGTITVDAPPGYYSNATPASGLRGRPGGAQPLNSDDAGSAQGSVSIPGFRGCGTGGQDLDPLLTSFISGPGNPVELSFTQAFTACSNTSRAEACPKHPAAAPAARAAASSAWSRLGARQRSAVVRKIARLPEMQRRLVIASLPEPMAAAVGGSER